MSSPSICFHIFVCLYFLNNSISSSANIAPICQKTKRKDSVKLFGAHKKKDLKCVIINLNNNKITEVFPMNIISQFHKFLEDYILQHFDKKITVVLVGEDSKAEDFRTDYM